MAHVFATLSVTLMLILLTLVFYVLVSRLYAFIYRWMRETILKAAAKRRALLLLSLALGAPIIGLVSVFAFILPSFFAFPSLYEHCHVSVCGPHVPDYFQSSNYIFALAALVSTLVGFSLFVFFRQQRRLENQIQCLIELLCNEQSVHNDYLHTINSEYPLLMNAGLISPRIIMSSKTKSQLGAEALQLILMYELIRCKRYDNLRSMIGKIFTIIWPNSVRKIFLKDLSNANHEVARQILSKKKNNLHNLQCLPEPQEISGLPIYVRQLIKSYANEQEQEQKQKPAHSILLNPVSFMLFTVHYLLLMIALTSLTHYLSDVFL
ncbi:hypothetical protein [Brumicola nitratireducens]|uniref:Uncharacterized protein n=1 Tax=Glaciecola nitratireducens (strain JCM 12485 / KCTC 12276 / FR1064) TaxID=1085623 RepID=G4QIJ8_GLANF|nr:hypothetical protein [Glaciecola nitratireducens]AEP31153.1 hypothetical protein GNIT_3058 [Glaciecola nitratireducens FR1064]